MIRSLLLCGVLAAMPAAAQELGPQLTVEGSAFVLRLPDGRVLRGAELQGATVHLATVGGGMNSVRLKAITPDPKDPALLRHEFEIQDEAGAWQPGCAANADGETWGFPIALPDGHPGREGEITLTCVSGAVGKCARFGYRPWAKGPGGENLTPYHAACVHMVRADYCGSGEAHTRDGTLIEIYDPLGIQKPESPPLQDFVFEAGWKADGAACVARTRWPELFSPEQLRAACPKRAQGKDGKACDEAGARKRGALLFNRSRTVPRIGK